MKKVLAILGDVRVWVGLILVALSVALFLFGGRFGLATVTKLFIVIGFLVVEMVVILLAGRRRRKEAADIEKSLLLEADSLVMTSSGAQRAANERAREELAEAIEGLKKSKIADGRSGRTALSVLPWYLLLGRPDSGKSTMIRNSGLPLPGSAPTGGPARAKAVGPGRSVQWWFTSHAVVLETHGRFVGREDDVEPRGDWQGALEVLRKSRPGVPLNGIVVAVSMEDVIRHDSARLDEQARVLRQRLDAATEHLEAHCPIYLVITKSDLVHGFEEFFRDLDGNARDQVFGATFAREQIEGGDPVGNFDREFETLYRSLCQRRVPRMVAEDRPAGRGDVYLFPLEFQSLRTKLLRFVKTLVEPNPYGDSPLFRGFYFTSGNCEGQPVEMVVNEVSRVIGLPPDLDGADVTRFISPAALKAAESASASRAPAARPAPAAEEDPRFLRELFTRVLLRDAGLARPTSKAVRARRTRTLALRVGGAVLLALLAVLMIVSFARNRGLVAGTVDLAREASLVPAGASTASEAERGLVRLDPLRARLADLDQKDRFRGLTYGFGLYKGKTINRSGRRVYFGRLVDVLLGPSRAGLEERLLSVYYPSPEEFGDWYRDYRAYRMLIEPDRCDPEFLADRLVRYWTSAGVGAGASERLRELIRAHVTYAWRHPNEVILHSADLPARNASLVARAGELIRENWQPETYYDAMIEEVNGLVPAFSLASIPGAGDILATDADSLAVDPSVGYVPGAYTMHGWRDQVAARIDGSEEQLKTDWILKEAFEGQRIDMREWLARTYREDYVARWNRFLSAVDVPALPGVTPAADRMRVLTGPGSPFVQLIDQAAQNLRSRGEDGSPLGDLEERYAALHSLFVTKGEGDQKMRPLDRFLALERGVVEALRQLRESGDPALASSDYAKVVLAGPPPGESPIPEAVRFVDRHCADLTTGDAECTAAVRALLRRPAEGAWGSIVADCQNYLDALWDTDVREQFRPLEGKFPFSPDGPDAPLSEFTRFFAPQGVVSTFLDGQLEPFLDHAGEARVIYRYGLDLSPGMKTAIAKARAFRRALFDPQGALALAFWVKPSQTSRVAIQGAPPPFARTSRLIVGSDRLLYDMGRAKETAFVWPGESRTGGARVAITTDQPDRDPPEIVAEGDWALFRLLARATITTQSDTEYDVRWRMERRDGSSAYAIEVPFRLRAASSTNPFRPGFFDFRCPRRLGREPGDPRTAGDAP